VRGRAGRRSRVAGSTRARSFAVRAQHLRASSPVSMRAPFFSFGVRRWLVVGHKATRTRLAEGRGGDALLLGMGCMAAGMGAVESDGGFVRFVAYCVGVRLARWSTAPQTGVSSPGSIR